MAQGAWGRGEQAGEADVGVSTTIERIQSNNRGSHWKEAETRTNSMG